MLCGLVVCARHRIPHLSPEEYNFHAYYIEICASKYLSRKYLVLLNAKVLYLDILFNMCP
jgi:hypothetical protein